MQAIARNCRNQCSDAKGEAQAAKTARREYRSGALGRTDSYERRKPVMGLEQRGRVRQLHHRNNWQQDVRGRLVKKPVQDLESDELGKLLPTTGACRLHSQK